jgi:hypothetical protein
MKEYGKWRSQIRSKLHVICISSNKVRHPVTKNFTTLHYTSPTPFHYTCRHFTSSHLNFTQLHFTTLSFGSMAFKFPTAPFHLTSLHVTSLHFTALLDDFHHTLFLSLNTWHLHLRSWDREWREKWKTNSRVLSKPTACKHNSHIVWFKYT